MPLPSLIDQAERLIELGVHDLANITAADLRTHASITANSNTANSTTGDLLITGAPASALAPLMQLNDKHGFVVEDMADVDAFRPTAEAPRPDAPYVVHSLERGDEFGNQTPAESLPVIAGRGRTPLTLGEGLHWVIQDPDILERNACFMTIGSRLRKPNGSYDSRTPALWISNGTGRDGTERKNAPKLGWCWWNNRHTWLGMASCAGAR